MGQTLAVIKTCQNGRERVRQDHRSCEDRAGERSAAGLVDAHRGAALSRNCPLINGPDGTVGGRASEKVDLHDA